VFAIKFHWTLSCGTVNQLTLSTVFNIHFNILSFLLCLHHIIYLLRFLQLFFLLNHTIRPVHLILLHSIIVFGDGWVILSILLYCYSRPYAHHEGIHGGRCLLPFSPTLPLFGNKWSASRPRGKKPQYPYFLYFKLKYSSWEPILKHSPKQLCFSTVTRLPLHKLIISNQYKGHEGCNNRICCEGSQLIHQARVSDPAC